MKNKIFNNKKGATALLVVVVVGAAALIMAVGAASLGLGELEMGYMAQKADETLYLADGCAEEALERLRKNPNYSGGNLNLGAGSCIISIIANGNDRTITVSASVNQYNKKVQLGTTINETAVTINFWSEVEL